MPWRGPEYPGEFPTLGYQVAELIEAKCAVPDGDLAGEPYRLTDEMLRFLLWFYRIDPVRERFVFDRGGQLIRPQKWGKGPFSAAIICSQADPDAPVLFDGWDSDGEPVGRPWPTPVIQVTAVSEDQTGNVWDVLLPMIEMGALAADITDTGLTRIFLPSGGKIEPVTSAANSRLGQRVTFVVQDETHAWTEQNSGRKLADTQRRNLAGTGGRWLETTNAWNPAERSVAQQTFEAQEPGVYIDDVEAGAGSIRNKTDRRRMLKRVYVDSHWVDLDRMESEIVTLLGRDPAQAERFFLNGKLSAEDAAFNSEGWNELKSDHPVDPGSLVVIGVDGARFDDSLAVVACEISTGFVWPIGIWTAPEFPSDDYEHPRDEVDGAIIDAFDRWDVWRVYCDPQWIEHLVDLWRGRWGEKRVMHWYTNRPRQTSHAVRNFAAAIGSGDLSHDGDETLAAHIRNARKRKTNVRDDDGRQMYVISKERSDSANKIDAAMAAVLAWEARGDAISSDAKTGRPKSRKAIFI